MLGLAWRAAVPSRDEFSPNVKHGACVPYHMEIQKPIMSHAQPDCSAFNEISDSALPFDSILLRFQKIMFLCFRSVFSTILTGIVRPVPWIEHQTMHCGRREHGHIQFMWVDPLIVLFKAALTRDAFRVKAELLLRLKRPPPHMAMFIQ